MREVIVINKKLTDLERQQVIVDYVAGCGLVSQQKLANKYGVSQSQIARILNSPEGVKAREEYIEEINVSMKDYKRDKTPYVQNIISKGLKRIDEQMPDASMHDAVGAVKVLIDAFDTEEAQAGTDYADMSTLAELLKIGEGEGDGEV